MYKKAQKITAISLIANINLYFVLLQFFINSC